MEKFDDCDAITKEQVILKGAVENTNEAFITIDEDHKVVLFNRAAERLFGYRREEVVGHDLDVILTPDCSSDHRGAVSRYIKEKTPRLIGHATELTATRKNREKFPALISFSVAEIGGKSYFTGIVRDLTETKSLQERILKSEQLAALGQVVAEITHEIKNPLVVIGGFANQLIKGIKDDKAASKLNIIIREVHRLDSLLTEFRELYRPRSKERYPVDVGELLEEVYAFTKDDSEKKNIRVDLVIADNLPMVEGESDKLRQVFINLIKNGIEAMEDGGRLLIEIAADGDNVEISFTDDGPGIPESIQKDIFTPFFTTKKHGTGLGLSISRKIITDHNGSFTFKSREGEGTAIKITIPILNDN